MHVGSQSFWDFKIIGGIKAKNINIRSSGWFFFLNPSTTTIRSNRTRSKTIKWLDPLVGKKNWHHGLVGGLNPWKIWKSIGMISNPIYGKIKIENVPNHQPDGCFMILLGHRGIFKWPRGLRRGGVHIPTWPTDRWNRTSTESHGYYVVSWCVFTTLYHLKTWGFPEFLPKPGVRQHFQRNPSHTLAALLCGVQTNEGHLSETEVDAWLTWIRTS